MIKIKLKNLCQDLPFWKKKDIVDAIIFALSTR
jgi:hypothetical protein